MGSLMYIIIPRAKRILAGLNFALNEQVFYNWRTQQNTLTPCKAEKGARLLPELPPSVQPAGRTAFRSDISEPRVLAFVETWPHRKALGYGMGDPTLEFRQGHENFRISKTSRTAKGPIHLHSRRVPRALPQHARLTIILHRLSTSTINRTTPPFPHTPSRCAYG